MQPLVLSIDPVRGWREASALRKTCTVGLPVLVVAFLLVVDVLFAVTPAQVYLDDADYDRQRLTLDVVVAALLGTGMVCCYHAARVLRPYRAPRSVERVARHVAAAVATAPGAMILIMMFQPWESDATSLSEGMVAVVLALAVFVGALSVAWGLVAFAVRLISRLVRFCAARKARGAQQAAVGYGLPRERVQR